MAYKRQHLSILEDEICEMSWCQFFFVLAKNDKLRDLEIDTSRDMSAGACPIAKNNQKQMITVHANVNVAGKQNSAKITSRSVNKKTLS